MKIGRIVIICFAVLFVSAGLADVPSVINYQGVLTDPSTGNLINGTYEMVFSIYSQSSGGSALWTETQNVDVEDGEFSVLLGSVSPVASTVFSGDERYLGIAVGGDSEMEPRKRLACVPYAFVSDKTQQVDWSDIDNMPAGFADGVDDAGGTAVDDAGREGVVNTLYEGNTALSDKYVQMYHTYLNQTYSTFLDITSLGTVLKARGTGPGVVKISSDSNPILKLWRGYSSGPEPDDENFLVQLQWPPDDVWDISSGALSINNENVGYCIKAHTVEGTGVYCSTDGGIAIHGKSNYSWPFLAEVGPYTPGIGVKGEGYNYGGFFVSQALPTSIGAYFEGQQYAAEFHGKIYVDGEAEVVEDLKVQGDIQKEYTSGNYKQAIPVAYAAIHMNGTVNEGTPNVSSVWNASIQRYDITIAGESYGYRDYITVVTPSSTMPYLARTGSAGGKLVVYIYNLSGDKVQSDFHFVTYKP